MSRRPARAAPERASDRGGDRRQAILVAATGLFVERGFAGTTTDEITRRAGASKETVYHHFGSKLGLFDAVLQHLSAGLSDGLVQFDDKRSVAEALTGFGRNYLQVVLRPEALGLFRLVIGEGACLPELGKVFYQRGPAATIAALADYLRRMAAEGHLHIDDAERGAMQFLSTLRGDVHMRALITHEDPAALDPAVRAAEIERSVEQAVSCFMRCFGM